MYIQKLFILFSVASIFFESCTGQKSEIFINPEHEVAKLLMQKRAVMVADYGHSNPAPYYSLLKMLNEWLELAILQEGNYSITLIWEHDSVLTNKVRYFMNTEDIDSIFAARYSYGTLEDIEFYNNLRKFRQGTANNSRINFELKGFEQVLDDNFLKLSQKESALWFVKVRDSIAANGIINYMQANEDNNILIFYGGTHLQNGYLEKQTQELKYSESFGYYLAHYLKEEFGEDEILTINQAITDSTKFLFTPLEQYKSTNILLSAKFVPEWERYNPQYYDMYILRHDVFIQQPHRLNFLFSRRGIEKAIKRLGELENILETYGGKMEYNDILEKLFIITGQRFTIKNEVEQWYVGNSFKGLKRIKEKEFAEQIFEYIYGSDFERREQKILNELGFTPFIFGPRYDTSEYKKIEKGVVEFLAFHNAVPVYWLGYPDEKEEAKKILIEYSGRDFIDPEQYLMWVRKTNFKTDY